MKAYYAVVSERIGIRRQMYLFSSQYTLYRKQRGVIQWNQVQGISERKCVF